MTFENNQEFPSLNIEKSPKNNILEMTKEQTQIIIQNISAFAKNIEAIEKYGDLEKIKKEINTFLMQIFQNALKDKTPDFILWFEQSNISKYQTQKEIDKVDLIQLLILKNKFYTEIIRNIVSLWKLDAILKLEEKQDILCMIDSGIFSFLDDIYLEWYKEVYNQENQWITTQKLNYGWVKNGKIVALKDFIQTKIHIDDQKLAQIENPHLREYFLLFSKFIKEWITDYDTWIDAETHEVRSWQDRKTIFWFVAPMEDYMYPGVLVEPELLLFLRNLEKKVNFWDFYGLSEEFFQERFWMDHMTLDFVETLLQTGDSAFWWFIWKAFPNDMELSQREWNCIILKDTTMKDVIHNSQKGLKILLWDDFEMDFDSLYNELIKEVTYHEFWHSLFVKWHSTSLLEEAKATLFYYLRVYKENKETPYSQDNIKKVVEFTLMDSIRNIERMRDSSVKKYVILTKINVWYLFSSGLISWKNGVLEIDVDNEKFDIFLSGLKDMLYMIQELYQMDEVSWKQVEIKILEKIERHIWEDIQKISEKLWVK